IRRDCSRTNSYQGRHRRQVVVLDRAWRSPPVAVSFKNNSKYPLTAERELGSSRSQTWPAIQTKGPKGNYTRKGAPMKRAFTKIFVAISATSIILATVGFAAQSENPRTGGDRAPGHLRHGGQS